MKSFHHSEFADVERLVASKGAQTISLCVPTFNEEDTIGEVIRILKQSLQDRHGLLDEVAVIDSGSSDRTREVAGAAGATVYLASEILPELGPARGKGENIWKSLACLKGDILCYVDGDVRNMHPRFVLGTVGPLLCEESLQYVKGYYDRPHAAAEVGVRPAGGGRVTEALVRPLFSLFFPELSGLIQPLAGEYAARREVLESLLMPTGYGVETAHLLDVLKGWGAEALAQTDLDERLHRHQDTTSLGRMSFSVLQAFFARTGDRVSLKNPMARTYHHFMREEGVTKAFAWECPDFERPPMREIIKRSAE
jgi:glucosyl-3-phosphoglycerate synthase